MFAKLDKLAASIPNITSINIRQARKICREYNEYVTTVTEGYNKGSVGQGTTDRGNYIPGVLAGLDELVASIPSITSISARRARKACREYNKYCN